MIRLRSKTTLAALMLATAVSCGRGDATVTTVEVGPGYTPELVAHVAVDRSETPPAPLAEIAPPELRDGLAATATPPAAALEALATIPAPEPQVEAPAEAPRKAAAAPPPTQRTAPVVTSPPTTAPPAPAPAPTNSGGAAADFASRINATRASRGLAALARDGGLDAAAAGWAVQLAQTGVLAHSSLPRQLVGNGYTVVGENVGVGPSVQVVYDALLASPSHLANIVGNSYSRLGVAVAADGSGRIWVVQLFGG